MVHYRVQHSTGHVTVSNNYYVEMSSAPPYPNPGAPPLAASPPQQLPMLVHGPNQNQVTHVAVPPIFHAPPQATHIAIPLMYPPVGRFGYSFRNFQGPIPRNGNMNMHALVPRFVHIGPAGTVRPPLRQVGPGAPMPFIPPFAYVVNPNGNLANVPRSVNGPTYVAIPSRVDSTENASPVEEVSTLAITEVTSTVDEELN